MTPQTTDKPVIRRPETGWARARRLRGKGVLRTCVPAVLEQGTTRTDQLCPEGNIVRGED
ncbi:hypothetical protein [Streptomyces guryensis]|uniref:Uncharacterized protein n=1 Tax=Streptomyces guryensis TaxID=2886947 RepID=A0A9Q3Z7G0_9ACTN|nr:hypothetical protein [Streptomyces guryensis]MCD9874527.1 hypothetical protein [Streptomyces guryensis]